MDIQSLVILLIVGGIAGWLAGLLVQGTGFGIIGDIIVGVAGSFVAGWLLPRLHIVIGGSFVAAIIDAVIGAVILLIVVRVVRRAI